MVHRLHRDRARGKIPEQRIAGQPQNAIDPHPTATANAHAARPSVRQRSVEAIFNLVERV
jgi:hypothetical protein